jgi:hypothetical protein
VQQADARGDIGFEHFAGDEQPTRLAQADGVDHIRGDNRRYHTQLDLGQGELGRVDANGDIAAGH